jgi:hypothetical protein
VHSQIALLLGAAAALGIATAAAAADKDGELNQVKAELARTRSELDATKSALQALSAKVEQIERAGAAAGIAAAPPSGPRIAPVNADNPAISFVVDTELATDRRTSYESIDFPNGTNFSLRNAELFLSAPIDPFLRGYASINGTSEEGFNVEEAALITTALPWNLTVKGGRIFADFGRLPHWHDEGLPFVDRPPSIERLIGGESTSEGAEVSWLAPTEHYIDVTVGAYNAVGAEYLDDLNTNGFFGRRDIGELTYLVHPHTYFDLTDTLNLEVGGSWLGVPNGNDHRNLWGFDVTLRHQPGTSGFYQGLVWGTEWLWNEQRFTERDEDGNVIGRMQPNRNGGYSYVEAFFARRYSAGVRFDRSESPDESTDLANTISAFVTWMPSEFHRLRFQFDNAWGDEPTNQRFTLQWTAFLGSHSHGFAQR